MLRIDNLKLPVGASKEELRAACAHALRVSAEALVSVHLLRRSIDAREGVKLVCSCAVEVKNESGVLRRCKNKNVQPYAPKKYTPPAPVSAPEVSPVVIGAGPAGLFCALLLARCGARPILLERGRAFWGWRPLPCPAYPPPCRTCGSPFAAPARRVPPR